MGIRTGGFRVMAFAVAATLSWSLWTTCAEGAMSPAREQMTCCQNGQQTCGQHGTPADCCKTAFQGVQFTTVDTSPAPLRPLLLTPACGSACTTRPASWHPRPLTDGWPPPGSKHPTYVRFSTFRL